MKGDNLTQHNALVLRKGAYFVKDQIILLYPKQVNTKYVKEQIQYLLGKKLPAESITVKVLDKVKNTYLIAAPGAHLLGPEAVAKLNKPIPVPPNPPPIIPDFIYRNTLTVQQEGIKNTVLFKADSLRKKR